MVPKLAIVVSRFNEDITSALLRGARSYLTEQDVIIPDSAVFPAPGAFELALIAQTLAKQDRYDGVICLGCVIKGETAHFEYISQATSLGIMKASLATEKPITFGVLTVYTDEQAIERCGNDASNKGREAAAACFEAVSILRQVRSELKQSDNSEHKSGANESSRSANAPQAA